jgi:hypothetical protein
MKLEWEDMKLNIIIDLSLCFLHRIIGTACDCYKEADFGSDSTGNIGAWINLKSDLKLQFETFEAVPHPNIKPMAYASNLIGSMM